MATLARRFRTALTKGETLDDSEFTPFRDIWQRLAGDIGIQTRRMLEYESARQRELSGLDQQIKSALKGAARTPADREQVETMREQGSIAIGMLRSGNPELRQTGGQLLLAVQAAQRDFDKTNEAQAIAEQARLDTLKRQGFTDELAREQLSYERDLGMASDLRQDVVEPWRAVDAQFDKVARLLVTGDRLGYDFAFTSLIQSLDNSVVRNAERLAYTGSNGAIAQIVDTYNKLQGAPTPELYGVLGRQMNALRGAVRENAQRGIEGYRQQVAAFEGDWSRVGSVIPDDLRKPVPSAPSEPPESTPTFRESVQSGGARELGSSAGELFDDAQRGLRDFTRGFWSGPKNTQREFWEKVVDEQERQARPRPGRGAPNLGIIRRPVND